MIGTWIAVGWCSLIYFLPFLVSEFRQHRRGGLIMAVNLLTGWTAIGWIIAMMWAMEDNESLVDDPGPVVPRSRAGRRGAGVGR